MQKYHHFLISKKLWDKKLLQEAVHLIEKWMKIGQVWKIHGMKGNGVSNEQGKI